MGNAVTVKMNPAKFHELLTSEGIRSCRELAGRLGVSPTTVRRWANGGSVGMAHTWTKFNTEFRARHDTWALHDVTWC